MNKKLLDRKMAATTIAAALQSAAFMCAHAYRGTSGDTDSAKRMVGLACAILDEIEAREAATPPPSE